MTAGYRNTNAPNNGRKPRCEWEEDRKGFINPYNFVSLGPSCPRKSWDEYRQDNDNTLLTGYLICRLYPRTPVFIPNTTQKRAFADEVKKMVGSEKEFNDCYSYDFFSYEDLSAKTDGSPASPPPVPIIPGSEIRGVIRSVYETITDSCLSTTNTSMVLHKRTPIPGKPGILKRNGNGKWYLYSPEKVMLKVKHCDKDKGFCDEHGKTLANMDEYSEHEKVLFETQVSH